MIVRLVSETSTTITFGWDPVPNARGFRFTTPAGKVSHTWDGARTSVKFAKADGVFLIEPLLVNEIGEGVYPPVVVPPPPPLPPPGQFGAKIDALFPWLKSYATMAANTTSITPKSGTAGAPTVVDATGVRSQSAIQWDGTYHDFVIRDLSHGGGAFDGIKVAGGASRFLVQRLHAFDLTGDKPQGFASQRGISQGALVGAILERCGSSTLAHGLYWGMVNGDCLVASVVAHGQMGYGLQFYPGPSPGTVYVTHATLFGSTARNAIVVENSKVEVHNSILGPNAQAGINIRSGGNIKVVRSCVPGADLSNPIYVDCITDNPDLDPVTFRPRNPKVLAFLGDPAWTPLHDCRGNPYTQPVIGAVA